MDTLPWMINGEYQSSVSVEDRGFHYGDGLFETMRVQENVIVNQAQHMQRLCTGLNALQIPASMALVEAHLQLYLSQTQMPALARLKIIVSRGGPARGYAIAASPQPTIAIGGAPYIDVSDETRWGGIRLRLCSTRLALNPALAGIKHLNRLEQVIARSEWQDESVFEGLMRDTESNIVEGTMSNVFMVKNSVLKTPPLDRCGVRGVMRGVILDCIAPELGLNVELTSLSLDDLRLADEVFISNSLIGTLACTQCDEMSWALGPVQQTIQGAIAKRAHQTVESK